jgi:metallo-beta-lactamase family protein
VRNSPTITFLGAIGTVTGSKYLPEADGSRVLVDCGLFEGKKALRQNNWKPLPVDSASLDAVLLTHAHLDHSGYLPVLIKAGFTGPVHCTSGTAALAHVLLRDSGHLQEEDARYANRKGFSKHHPALPLYTKADAEASLTALRPVSFNQPIRVNDKFSATFHRGGHILGASWIEVNVNGARVAFSGDVG